MSSGFPMVALKEIVEIVERPETVIAGKLFRQIGVRLWGGGAYERESVDGSQTKYQTLSRVEADDIIVNKIWARNGSVAVVTKELAGCYGSGEFPTFSPDHTKLEPRWFHWLTKIKGFWAQCDEKSQGTSGKNRIRPEQFLKVTIPLPPLAEQRRIVAHIEELAAKVEEARGLRRGTLEEIEMIRASAAKVFFVAEKHLDWPTVALGDATEIHSGVTLGRILNGPTVRLPYLRVANVQDGYLNLQIIKEIDVLESEVNKWLLQSGDILLTEGGDWDKLGRGAVWRGEIPTCIHQNHIFRVRAKSHEFDPDFLATLIGPPYGKSYFQAASKQTTNLASINRRQLSGFKVFRPPLLEQRRIVAYLDDLQARVDAVKQLQAETQAELDALLPSILDKAFRGELV